MIVVVGGGVIAEAKIPALLTAGARVRVVAPQVTEQIAKWVRDSRIELRMELFEPGDLDDAFLVIAATSAAGVNEAVFREAEARRIFCNAVDDIENCHFYYGSIVQRGDLQIAISTNGKSPALAQRIRKELEETYPSEYALWLEWLGAAREHLRATSTNAEESKSLLHQLATPEMFLRFINKERSGETRQEATQ